MALEFIAVAMALGQGNIAEFGYDMMFASPGIRSSEADINVDVGMCSLWPC